ncbi:hypothetical protein JAAARDRAFT_65471 [Jaapia argillacea MUCL 33604]|uniref:Seipin n=1 Tax=Jaapia argillacea MUCL 33604 TaxID=933084 RepID=A0A067Q8R4_9AGAM|nr:hypothetical protein JAAARDRAFT_65471 [Jaapia argillacea MUCL 33604]
MDVKPIKQEDQISPAEQPEHPTTLQRIAYAPLNLFLKLLSASFRLIRPFAPQIIPLIVCVFVLPLLVLLSLSAGYYVWRSVAIGWETELNLQYGDGVPPYADVFLPRLVAEQPYDISLQLSVPATEQNYGLGNFMTSLTISTISNKTLTTVRKPTLVLPPSLSIIPFSGRPGIVKVAVPLLSDYAPGVRRALARVELGRRDNWRTLGVGQGRELSVFSASLRGVVVHKGIRGIVTRFPLLSALISSAIFLISSFITFAACLLPAIQWRLHHDTETYEQEQETQVRDRVEREQKKVPVRTVPSAGSSFEEKPLRKKRSGKRSSRSFSVGGGGGASSSRRAGGSGGTSEASLPQGEGSFEPLVRRRRSQLSERQSDSD